MLNLQFDNVRTVLCLGSHADDIEIGCGGTLLKLLAENPGASVYWVVLSATGQRAVEAVRSAESFLRDAGHSKIVVQGFQDSFFPYCGREIKEYFHQLKHQVEPDLVFTHRREDLHQDHRLVAEFSWNTFRNHLILEYEIPKYEGDLGHPNFYVPLDESLAARKVQITTSAFQSQRSKPWFSEDTFWALLRIRGLECHSASKFAEAFHCRKLTAGTPAPANVHGAGGCVQHIAGGCAPGPGSQSPAL